MKSKAFYKSKSNQNLIEFRKKNKLSLKYSNLVLFERRELQLLQKKKSHKKFLKSRQSENMKILNSNYNSNQNSKKNIFSVNQFFTFDSFPSFNQCKTASDFHSMKSPSHCRNKNKIQKLFLSEENLLQNKIITKSKVKNPNKKEALKNELDKIYRDKKISKNNINFLLTIQKDLKEYRERNKEDNNIDKKIEKLNIIDNSRYGMVHQLKNFNSLQYLVLLKKEREETQKGEKENEIQFIKEKIDSLNNAFNIFNVKFMNRISDYIRYLDCIKNTEKTKNIQIIKEKMKIKREIFQLNNEIEKIKEKKNDILRWIYLQIKVKEKKLILPKYYKKIIEANKAQILYMESKFDINSEQIIKREREDKLRAKIIKKSFFKKETLSKHQVKSFQKDKSNPNVKSYFSERVVYGINKIASNLNLYTSKKNEEDKSPSKIKVYIGDGIYDKSKDMKDELITKEEFDRIVFWKFRPIYQTADEFINRLNHLDSHNIRLLEYYNQLQFKIYCLRQELNQVRNSRDKYDINIDQQISQKSIELQKIRSKHILILKTQEKINEDKKFNKKKKDKTQVNNNFSDSDIKKIYHKLSDIFDSCKVVNNQLLTELIYYHIKSESTKEGEMIYLIEYIECTLDFLLGKISLYQRDDNLNEKVHDIIVQIDKEHKLEKPKKQKLEDKKKQLNLVRRVMKKSEQQYITPRRPIDLIHYNVRELGKHKKKKLGIKDDFPKLKDFIENPNIINDNNSNNDENM